MNIEVEKIFKFIKEPKKFDSSVATIYWDGKSPFHQIKNIDISWPRHDGNYDVSKMPPLTYDLYYTDNFDFAIYVFIEFIDSIDDPVILYGAKFVNLKIDYKNFFIIWLKKPIKVNHVDEALPTIIDITKKVIDEIDK